MSGEEEDLKKENEDGMEKEDDEEEEEGYFVDEGWLEYMASYYDADKAKKLPLRLIAVIATILTLTTSILLRNQQNNNFTAALNRLTGSWKEESTIRTNNIHNTFQSLSKLVTSEAQVASGTFKSPTWPFVTEPSFENIGEMVREITETSFVSFCPLVYEDETDRWGVYVSKMHDKWVKDSFNHRDGANDEYIVALEAGVSDYIHNLQEFDGSLESVEAVGPGPFAPMWQITPPATRNSFLINYDVLSSPHILDLYNAMIDTNGPVLSKVLFDPEPPFFVESESNQNTTTTTGSLTDPSTSNASQAKIPHFVMLFPIFHDNNHTNARITGFLMALFSWETYLSSLMSWGGDDKSVLVLQSTCDEDGDDIFTFQQQEDNTVLFLGEGDLHDEQFEEGAMVKLMNYNDQCPDSTEFSNLTPNGQHCSYYMHVYPSNKMKKANRTITSGIFVIMLFLLMMLVLLLWYVFTK